MDDLKIYAKNRNELESMMNTVRIFSGDIGMQFGLDKCVILLMKRGKIEAGLGDMIMPNGGEIRAMGEKSKYRYLGVLEGDDVKKEKVKHLVSEEYNRRLNRMLKSKLNGGNLIKAINTYAVAAIRYTAGIVKWNKEELDTLDRKTRKRLTTYGGFHPKSDVDRLYVERRKGGRGLLSVKDVVEEEERQLKKYTERSLEDMMETVRERISFRGDRAEKKERYEAWSEKVMHGLIERQTKEVRSEESWMWLQRGTLKRETESLITAAQEQALPESKDRERWDITLCPMCKQADETVSHIVSECGKMAQSEYKGRHDKVATAVHWGLAKKHGLEHSEQWYQQRAEKVSENDKIKLFWDFNVFTDRVIEARRPDIIVLNKETKECLIVDIAVPGDTRVNTKEDEKIEEYRELCRELERLWRVKRKVVSVVVGALGTIPTRLTAHLKMLDINLSIETIQKSAILGTARILRKVLEARELRKPWVCFGCETQPAPKQFTRMLRCNRKIIIIIIIIIIMLFICSELHQIKYALIIW